MYQVPYRQCCIYYLGLQVGSELNDLKDSQLLSAYLTYHAAQRLRAGGKIQPQQVSAAMAPYSSWLFFEDLFTHDRADFSPQFHQVFDRPLKEFLRFGTPQLVADVEKLFAFFESRQITDINEQAFLILLTKRISFLILEGSENNANQNLRGSDDSVTAISKDLSERIYRIYRKHPGKKPHFPKEDFVELYRAVNVYPLDSSECVVSRLDYEHLKEMSHLLSDILQEPRANQREIAAGFLTEGKQGQTVLEQNPATFSSVRDAKDQAKALKDGYRDAASLSVYCKYADMYKDRTDYAGGQDELATITLKYDTSWQQDVDALETRVKSYKAEKDAAEEAERKRIAAENAAKQEQSLKDQYSGKLPVEGMPMSCLKYTSLGSPDKTEKCRGFDNLVEEKRSYTVYWYDSEGRIQAAGHCFKGKHYEEYMLISFSYYDYSISNSFGHNSTSDNSSDNGGSSVRNDYDNPEDLWEDNQDWYEDEDEAWDEWYDG